MTEPFRRNSIAQCLFLLATALLLVFLACYLPGLGTVAVCLWALPVVLAMQKNGVAAGVIVAVVATALTAFFIDLGTALFVLGLMGVLGVFYGARMKNQNSDPIHTFLGGVIIIVALAVAVFGILLATGVLDIAALKASVESDMHQAFAIYNESLERSDLVERGTSLKGIENEVIAVTLQILPGALLSLLIVVAGVNYVLADRYCKKKNFDFPALPLFWEWHFPWWLLWGFLIALGLLVLGNGTDNELYVVIAKNAFFCYAPLMLIAGISFTRWIMVRWHLGSGLCAVIWIAAVIFPTVSAVYFIITGVADTMFDYRKSFNKQKFKEEQK